MALSTVSLKGGITAAIQHHVKIGHEDGDTVVETQTLTCAWFVQDRPRQCSDETIVLTDKHKLAVRIPRLGTPFATTFEL